jgi:hypothetical protein
MGEITILLNDLEKMPSLELETLHAHIHYVLYGAPDFAKIQTGIERNRYARILRLISKILLERV